MAQGDGRVYRSFKKRLMEGAFDLSSDTIKCALVSGYTQDDDGHAVWGDVSASEITDTSYTAQTLTGLSVASVGTGTGTSVKGKWDAADVTFSSLTCTDPSHAILYDDSVTGTAADALIAAFELTTTTNGGNYTLSWNASGILTIS